MEGIENSYDVHVDTMEYVGCMQHSKVQLNSQGCIG